jgi:1-acyl-sn-glycerol-3-phosphate acyltransferase
VIARLRTAIFAVVFYALTVLVLLTVPFSAMIGHRALAVHAHGWARLHRWAARYILGITVRVEGAPLPGQALYAAKHQSMFETTELAILLGGPAVVLKRELARIPLWGWAAQRYGAIVVDREASAGALRGMMREAQAARESGRSVVIYPEGTRVAPGERPPLRPGFAGLYRALALPTVPIAVDTGLVWPRRGPKRPGVVTIRFGEPIPPGLPRLEVEQQVHAGINALESGQPR